MINGYDIEVKLLRATPGPEDLLEYAGRLCYDTTDKVGSNPNWIQARIRDGHESIIEHASASFYIRASRVLTHELVRHRLASYSQRSQRYVEETEPRYITPAEFIDPSASGRRVRGLAVFHQAMVDAWAYYRDLLEQGWPAELARYVLPGACETQIVCTWNFRELRHIIKLRTSKRALPEMQAVAGEIRRICKEVMPAVFQDL